MKLIDADALKESLSNFVYGLRGWVFDIINDQPTYDIVICKDCKHYKPSEVARRKMCFRKDASGFPVCYDFLPNDWCKYGERKETLQNE